MLVVINQAPAAAKQTFFSTFCRDFGLLRIEAAAVQLLTLTQSGLCDGAGPTSTLDTACGPGRAGRNDCDLEWRAGRRRRRRRRRGAAAGRARPSCSG